MKPSQRRAQRQAYGRMCQQGFLLIQSIANFTMARAVSTPQKDILTPDELEYLEKLRTRIDKNATLLRDFGHRVANADQ